MINLETSWKRLLENEFKKNYIKDLKIFLTKETYKKTIYPRGDKIFQCFNNTPYHKVKIVIIGQDPYHQPNQANGLCFSVKKGLPIPPSLKNIFQELRNDLNIPIPKHGDLTSWSKQGILLLNSVLTVEKNRPNSHKNKGWEKFTSYVIKTLDKKEKPVVFMLWGKYAQRKMELINNKKHFILKSCHPSPFSAHRGFLGCKHFSKANIFLRKSGVEEIDWNL